MKALTVWQPWASLITIGAKPYEFRRWRPPRSIIGQRIAIHAGARKVDPHEVVRLIQGMNLHGHNGFPIPCLISRLAEPQLVGFLDGDLQLPLSHVLCTAIVGEPKSGDECAKEFGWNAGNDSDREGTFNWGWPMQDVEVLAPPIPARGKQGLWNWREIE